MNKSKFKTVKFLPLDRFLHEQNSYFWRDVGTYHDIMFEEKFIEKNETLFEVEKAEREFEDGAYYKAQYDQYFGGHDIEIIRCQGAGAFKRVGIDQIYIESSFLEIGEKIEL